jgi:uncharacterized protein YndB with AHSA1/START domain
MMRPAMRWILWSITLFMLLMGAVVIAGGLVAREHQITRTVALAAPPAAVFAAIADLEAMPAWRPEVSRVERVPVPDDQDGLLPTYRALGVRGAVTWTVVEARPPARLTLRIEGAGPGFEGTWVFDVASASNVASVSDGGSASDVASAGTQLTITERGEIENPLFRFLSRFVVGYGNGLDAYLAALSRHLGRANLARE